MTHTLSDRELGPELTLRQQLTVVHSPSAEAVGRTYPLDGRRLLFGREVQGDGLIPDPRMSRRHAEVRREGVFYEIACLGATNGSFLNGQRLALPEALFVGDVIRLGDTLLVMDGEQSPDDLPARPDVPAEPVPGWVGDSLISCQINRALHTVAQARGSVLILGATGVGKEVSAQAIHHLSGRTGAFVPVNCAAIAAELAESEFFGHVKGAFTGAERDRDGHFVHSSGGTLFLDEVGDLPLPLQAKLLRVLEEQEVTPVGSSQAKPVDLRVVAATLVDLDNSGFRQDLLARIADWTLRLPSLRQRPADILALWRHFVETESDGDRSSECTPQFAEALLLHDWPMNVRELRKLALRLVGLVPAGTLFDVLHLPIQMQERLRRRTSYGSLGSESPTEPHSPTSVVHRIRGDSPQRGPVVREAMPRKPLGRGAPPISEIEEALREAQGNVTQAAQNRGWHRTQLYRWLKRARLDPESYR
ncbi:MAG: sigma 54-interacting transcriptional regulator [Myxococcota bacterium]